MPLGDGDYRGADLFHCYPLLIQNVVGAAFLHVVLSGLHTTLKHAANHEEINGFHYEDIKWPIN